MKCIYNLSQLIYTFDLKISSYLYELSYFFIICGKSIIPSDCIYFSDVKNNKLQLIFFESIKSHSTSLVINDNIFCVFIK